MPVDTVSFWLEPVGFLDRNTAQDVPKVANGCYHDPGEGVS